MVGGLVFFIIFILVIAAIIKDGLFIVKQQHAVIIERLGKFNRFVGAGFHVKIPFFERKATTVSLRTMKNGFSIDVKTEDNVTIGLDISAQLLRFWLVPTGAMLPMLPWCRRFLRTCISFRLLFQ